MLDSALQPIEPAPKFDSIVRLTIFLAIAAASLRLFVLLVTKTSS